MSETKKILITLTPLDKFYFGGEMGFERKSVDAFNDNFGSYVVKSNFFPQQSSLMGMLRYCLLLSDKSVFDGKKITNRNAAKELIGEKSFQINDKFETVDFKKIKSIDACFIQYKIETDDSWDNLIAAPLDYDYEVTFEDCNSLHKTFRSRIPIVEGYKAKDGIAKKYISETRCVPEKELFYSDTRIGIDRDFNGKTKEGAYYKQTFYRFGIQPNRIGNEQVKDSAKYFDARFAFHAELAVDIIDKLKEQENILINLGGDSSKFKLTVEDMVELKLSPKASKVVKGVSKVVLLSDAYIKPEELDNCLFALNEIVSFRFLSTTIDIKNYTKFKNDELKRSEKYNLHQKGSVYYFENDEFANEFTSALENKKCFTQIGYNQYKSFKN